MAVNREVKNYVSPSLHPNNITGLEGWNDETRGYVTHAAEALDEAYQSVGAVIDARNKIRLDDTRTDRAKVLLTAEFADKHTEKVRKRCETSWNRLTDGICHMEKELSKPVEEYAGIGNVASEIRNHLKSMSQGDRMKFMAEALERFDERTIKSALGAPAYLSGMTDPEHKHFTRLYHSKASPVVVARLDLMKAAREKLDRAKTVFVKEMEGAIGAKRFEVERLKAANNAAEMALVMKQFVSADS